MLINNIKLLVVTTGLLVFSACGDTAPKEETAKTTQSTTVNTERAEDKQVILFFGNSLTAGYGVKTEESFPALIQQRIDSLGLNYEVINAGVSGETTATGLNRLDWVLGNYEVNIFVLELGANDGLRGLPPEQTQKNLLEIIDKVRALEKGVEVILAGMMVPPSMGSEYMAAYNPIFKEIALNKDIELIPFLLQGVGGIDSLNQDDGIHPNPKGNLIVRENVWEILGPMLEQ
ncbi:arylesterase [Cryomorphaceae bacterium 1068]|nr:arylesterase [Cryomorphaceae bacterium 1068]